MKINIILIFVAAIVFYFIVGYLKKEKMTNDEKEKNKVEDNKKKVVFSILVDTKKLKDGNKHIKGFGSQTSLNVYRVHHE